MVRTQIYLPEAVHKRLLTMSKQKKTSMAHLIRDYIEGGIHKDDTLDMSGKKAVVQLSQLKLTGGPKDLSSHLDKYLYG